MPRRTRTLNSACMDSSLITGNLLSMQAQKMVETTAEAFEVTLKKVEAAALKKTEEENEASCYII